MGRIFNLPNIPKNDDEVQQKRGMFRFFELFFRKFVSYAKINLLFFGLSLPIAVIVFLGMYCAVGFGMVKTAHTLQISLSGDMTWFWLITSFGLTCFFTTVIGIGPVSAGVSYVFLCYAREEHSWIWEDISTKAKENFKQAIFVLIIDLIVMGVLLMAFSLYLFMDGPFSFLKYVTFAMIVLYVLMHMYLYPQMVTFKQTVPQLYKNSFYFALGKFPSAFMIMIVLIILHIGLPLCAYMFLGKLIPIALGIILVLEMFVLQSFSMFMINFNANSKLKEYMK